MNQTNTDDSDKTDFCPFYLHKISKNLSNQYHLWLKCAKYGITEAKKFNHKILAQHGFNRFLPRFHQFRWVQNTVYPKS
jgi:hypothetical protein